jgi:4-amino-4-deoxy-L-arabinose transferase-like glycosyltransferase
MARHFLHGEFSTFYWGQAYGGTTEVGLIAAVFGIAGSGTIALRLVPMALYALAALLVWRVGRRTIGEPGATVAGLVFWISPAYFVFRSTREYGYEEALLVLGLAVLLLALRLRERPTRRDALGFGLALGLGWWTSIQIALVALPALVWLIWRQPRIWRFGWLIASAAYAGAFPWINWNLSHHWQSLHVGPGTTSSYGFRLGGFFVDALPTALGLRVPWLLTWLPSRTLGMLLFVAAAAALLAVLLRRRSPLELPAAVALTFPFVYAASPFTANRLEPRYLILLAPVLALLLGSLLADRRAAAAGLAAAAAIAVVALVRVADSGGIAPGAPDVRAPADLGPLVRTLKREGVSRAWADYWVAFRVTFLTREHIVVAPTYSARYPRYNELVEESPGAARIFVAGTKTEPRSQLLKQGFRRMRTGRFIVYLPSKRTAPVVKSVVRRMSLIDRERR